MQNERSRQSRPDSTKPGQRYSVFKRSDRACGRSPNQPAKRPNLYYPRVFNAADVTAFDGLHLIAAARKRHNMTFDPAFAHDVLVPLNTTAYQLSWAQR